MYKKSELCIKVENRITPTFQSSIGVKQGDVLSPNLFKIFINDLPDIFLKTSGAVNVNDNRVDCLMYADDIVILSETQDGLQERMNLLSSYCSKWCLNVNISKTNVVIFNKSGRLLKHPIFYNNTPITVSTKYKYLGIIISNNGNFSQCKTDLYKKSMKACFKLQNCLSSSSPSIDTYLHLYDHTIKPILTHGSEIWGMFSTNSASCKKESNYCFEKIFLLGHSELSHTKFLKYILGVNKKASNLAVMSELGRYPLYFSIILSMIKYCYRLEEQEKGLLFDSYICNKNLHLSNINTWYSSILYIMNELQLPNLKMKLCTISKLVKQKLTNSFNTYWNKEKINLVFSNKGKLDTYFSLKSCFGKEKYLFIKDFSIRQSICKLRISAHPLNIEAGRYKKIPRSDRKCTKCSNEDIEDEKHFMIDCIFYENYRKPFFGSISHYNQNFKNMSNEAKFIWLLTNEDERILKELGLYIKMCLQYRGKN